MQGKKKEETKGDAAKKEQKPAKAEAPKEETAEEKRQREEKEALKREKKEHKHEAHLKAMEAKEGGGVMDELSKKQVFKKFSYRGLDLGALINMNMDEIIKVADGIRQDIASLKIPCDEVDVSVTISAGATLFDGAEIDAVIKRVDEALYTAKNNGRNRVEYL